MPSLFDFDISRLPGNPLRKAWDTLRHVPGGRTIFSKMIGETAPYSGTLGAQVEKLERGHAELSLEPRRRLKNHLNSIHAVALMNLGEMCSGTCLMYSMPDDMRGIVAKMDMEYIKKARGRLLAVCDEEPVEPKDHKYRRVVTAEIYDESGDLCAVFSAEWDLSPKLKG
jgi:acyl-coenzyme A thioesterase PaaI-like protein